MTLAAAVLTRRGLEDHAIRGYPDAPGEEVQPAGVNGTTEAQGKHGVLRNGGLQIRLLVRDVRDLGIGLYKHFCQMFSISGGKEVILHP